MRPPSGIPSGFSNSHVPVAVGAHAPLIIQACFRQLYRLSLMAGKDMQRTLLLNSRGS